MGSKKSKTNKVKEVKEMKKEKAKTPENQTAEMPVAENEVKPSIAPNEPVAETPVEAESPVEVAVETEKLPVEEAPAVAAAETVAPEESPAVAEPSAEPAAETPAESADKAEPAVEAEKAAESPAEEPKAKPSDDKKAKKEKAPKEPKIKAEKTPKAPKEPNAKKEKQPKVKGEKAPKKKKAKKEMPPDYIGRPKPMKTKKFEFHKPTTKFYVELGIWLVVIGFIAYIAIRIMNVGSNRVTNVLRYEFKESVQPEAYTMENEYLFFSMDPFTTSFTITQKDTGHVWYSNPPEAKQDRIALAKEKDNLSSTFLLKYSTENGVDTIYDFNSYSVAKKVYEIIQNGNEITVNYSIGDIEPVYWYPMAITEKNMDKWLEKMSTSDQRSVKSNYRRLENGTFLPSDDVAQLLKDYPMLKDEAIYLIRDTVQTYLKEKAQDIFAKAGYTYDDYVKDLEMYAGGKEKNVPGFNVTVIYKLDGKNFIVDVPFDKIAYKTSYPIIRLSILPYFGASTYGDEGFMLVPEGGGSIINFNNGKTRQNAYYTDIYGWDYATDRKAVMTETRSAFPAFGISFGDSGFVSIIDKGAEYAGIDADVSGRMNSYNFVYAEYKMLHAEQYEASSRNINTQYAYEKGLPQGESISQIYSFINSGSYVDMAKAYKSYLFSAKNVRTKNKDVPVAIEVIGAIDKVQQVAGVPRTRPYKLTSYKETDEIISRVKDIGISNTYYKLSGFINGGVRQKLLNKFKFIKQLGGSVGFKKLVKDNSDEKLYLDGTVQYAHRTGFSGGFNKYKDAARYVSTKICEISEYSSIYYGKMDNRDTYFLLRPDLSEQMTNNLIKNVKKNNLSGVSFRDNGYFLSSDFNNKRFVSRIGSKEYQIRELESVKNEGLGVMINAGNSYAVTNADFITNLVMHGNEYALLDKSVPFYQIALHGNVNYAGTPINLSPENKQGILEAAESGAALYFTFMNDSEKRLQETNYTEYFASNFDNWEAKLEEIYNDYNKNMADVIDCYIDDHQYVSNTVTVTTFDNGKKVYVNFGYTDFTTDEGISIPARDYKVVGGR